MTTKYFKRFILFVFLLSWVVYSSGCLKKKSKIKSDPSSSNSNLENERRLRLDWLESGQAMLLKKYTGEMHQTIIKEVMADAIQVYMNSSVLSKLKTKVYILNSLPGTGKTQFVKDLAEALGIGTDKRFLKFDIDQKVSFIDSTPILTLSEPRTELIDRNQVLVDPAIIVYDEYTHLKPTESYKNPEKYISDRKEAKAKFQELAGRMQNLMDDASSHKEYTEEIRQNLRFLKSEVEKQANVEAEAITEIQRGANKINDMYEKAMVHFKVFWSALGDGTLTSSIVTNTDSLESSLKDLMMQLANLITTESGVFFDLADVVDDLAAEETRLRENWRSNTGVIPDIKDTNGDGKPDQTTIKAVEIFEDFKNRQEKYKALTVKKEQLENLRIATTAQINELTDSWESRNVMASFADTYKNNLDLLLGSNAKINFPEAVKQQFLRSRGKNPGDVLSQRQLKIVEGEVNNAQNKSDVDNLLTVFQYNPSAFLNVYQNQLKNKKTNPDKYTGHIVVFLTGNIIEIQNAVYEKIGKADTFPECAGIKPPPGLPKLGPPDSKDPGCFAKIVSNIVADPKSQEAMDKAFFNVFGLPKDQFENQVALGSRIGGKPHFVNPPRAEDYLNLISNELERIANTLKSIAATRGLTVPEIHFADSLKAALYEDKVDAQLGFRPLSNKSTGTLLSLLSFDVLKEISIRIGEGVSESAGYNCDNGESKLPTAVTFGFDRAKLELTVDYAGANITSRKLSLSNLQNQEFLAKKLNMDRALQYASFLAGEIGLGTLLMGSIPGTDVGFAQDSDGKMRRAKVNIGDWNSPTGRIWIYDAYNILMHLAGPAAEIALLPGFEALPETGDRYMQVHVLINSLFSNLREAASKIPNGKPNEFPQLILNQSPKQDFSALPVLKELSALANKTYLDATDTAAVSRSALNYVVNLIKVWEPYLFELRDIWFDVLKLGQEGSVSQTQLLDWFQKINDYTNPLAHGKAIPAAKVQAGQFNVDFCPAFKLSVEKRLEEMEQDQTIDKSLWAKIRADFGIWFVTTGKFVRDVAAKNANSK